MSARLKRIEAQSDYIFVSACKGCEYILVYSDALHAVLGARLFKRSAKVKRLENVLYVKFKRHDGVYVINASAVKAVYEVKGGIVVEGLCQ